MTLNEAISNSKGIGEWSIVEHEPTSVDIDFVNDDGKLDQTQFDLYSDKKEEELTLLFHDFCEENNFPENRVVGVYAYGGII